MFLFDPPENIRKHLVFWCFQGDQEGTLERKGLRRTGFACIGIKNKYNDNNTQPNFSGSLKQSRNVSIAKKFH